MIFALLILMQAEPTHRNTNVGGIVVNVTGENVTVDCKCPVSWLEDSAETARVQALLDACKEQLERSQLVIDRLLGVIVKRDMPLWQYHEQQIGAWR